jgi:hypothetical protein
MLSLMIAWPFSVSSDVFTGCTVSDNTQLSKYSTSAYENVTTHEGDLIINGTQTYVVENCTYIQRGNILVSDSANMIVHNSVFTMDQDYWHQFQFIVDEQARLEITNSSVDAPKGFGLECLGYSKINMNQSDLRGMGIWADGGASVLVSNCTAPGLNPSGNCRMVVLNSSLDAIGLYIPPWSDPGFIGVIDGLQPGYIGYLRLRQNQTAIDVECDLTLANTTVNCWNLSVPHETKVVLSNSTIETLWILYHQVDVEIHGLHQGYFEDFDIFNLTLRKIRISDIMVAISDSASAKLIDTTVSLHFFEGECSASLSNSDAIPFYARFSSGILSFDRSSLACDGIVGTQLYILGNVTHVEWQGDWFSSNVTRSYTIVMRDTSNNSLDNIELTLFGPNETALLHGFSDNWGTASFNITFADLNYTDTLNLQTYKKGFYNVSETISLLSSTPICINLTEKPLGDINEDHVVNILDVFIVALAFGAKPGDTNWDIKADLDANGVIDILDVFAVARDYGKTV